MAQLPQPRFKFDYSLVTKIFAALMVIEGGGIALNARRVVLEGMGGIRASYVQLIGIHLAVLGIIALVALLIPNIYYKDRKLVSKFIGLVPLLVGFIIAVEALVVAYFATPLYITDTTHVRIFWVAALAAQLFFIGAGVILSRALAGRENFGLTIIIAVTLIVGTIGIFIIAIAAETTIMGLGSLSESTMFVIGVQFLTISVIMLSLLALGNRSFLCKKVHGFTLSTLGVIILGMIVSVQGLMVLSYAGQITIEGLGIDTIVAQSVLIDTLPERTMPLFGLAIAFLGMAIPVTIFSRVKYNNGVGNLTMYSVVFLLLLFPFALFV